MALTPFPSSVGWDMIKSVLRRPQSSFDIKTFQDWLDFEMSQHLGFLILSSFQVYIMIIIILIIVIIIKI